MTDHIQTVQPPDWAPPKGYVNGMIAHGRTLYVAGQVGWNKECVFESSDFVAQFAQALDNVLAVVTAAGGLPSHVVRMTVYATDLTAYRDNLRSIGKVWKERFGKHFPAMALVGVAGLVEEGAKVEIEATAVLPPGAS
ncbi:MAG: RidA family protein [Polyangiaceae bacterium]|nr:RidA family protein [Polyangiaceae bacterium]